MKNKSSTVIGICVVVFVVAFLLLLFVLTFEPKTMTDNLDAEYLNISSHVQYLIEDINIDKTVKEDQLESELELKRMLSYIKPLMSIFLQKNKQRQKKYLVSVNRNDKTYYNQDENLMIEEARSRRRRNKRKRKPSEGSTVLVLVPERQMDNRYDYIDDFDRYDGDGDFGEYVLASGGGGSYSSCCKNNRLDFFPFVALLALAALLLYYITITTTTTTSSGRKRRQVNNAERESSKEKEDIDYQDVDCNQKIKI